MANHGNLLAAPSHWLGFVLGWGGDWFRSQNAVRFRHSLLFRNICIAKFPSTKP
jgi:hypothetical protein